MLNNFLARIEHPLPRLGLVLIISGLLAMIPVLFPPSTLSAVGKLVMVVAPWVCAIEIAFGGFLLASSKALNAIERNE